MSFQDLECSVHVRDEVGSSEAPSSLPMLSLPRSDAIVYSSEMEPQMSWDGNMNQCIVQEATKEGRSEKKVIDQHKLKSKAV